MTVTYVWQSPGWPAFRWDEGRLAGPLGRARLAQGRLLGKIAGLGFPLTLWERARVLGEEALRTSAIEGEVLDAEAVRSSVARRLGLPDEGRKPTPRHVDGLVDALLDATTDLVRPLTAERLRAWQTALFPTGRSGLCAIVTGEWRAPGAAMQVVSGPIGREQVHFEAPPAERLDQEVGAFLAWFAAPPPDLDGLIRAGLAHLWLVTLHPFEGGNGRIARAVGELALAQDDGQEARYSSLSAHIEAYREAYYQALEHAQRGALDVTDWLLWFLAAVEGATHLSEVHVDAALTRARFWTRLADTPLNERQAKLVRRLLDATPTTPDATISTQKAARVMRVSPATAQRDLADLVAKGVLARGPAGGRSTAYHLILT